MHRQVTQFELSLVCVACLLGAILCGVIAGDRPEAHTYQQFRGSECEACGGTNDLEWAHAYPYALSTNGLEYLRVSETNGVTLCRDDHFRIAHYGNWKKWNSNLIPIVKALKEARQE